VPPLEASVSEGAAPPEMGYGGQALQCTVASTWATKHDAVEGNDVHGNHGSGGHGDRTDGGHGVHRECRRSNGLGWS
jgi:hypothetical protein